MRFTKIPTLLLALASASAATSSVAAAAPRSPAAPPRPKKVLVSPAAAVTKCEGETLTGAIKGSVQAHDGCYLEDATVKGSVTVEPGGELTTDGTVDITGSVKATDTPWFSLEAQGTIDGNVDVVDPTQYVYLAEGTVKGSVTISRGTTPSVLFDRGDFLGVEYENIDKNLTVDKNVFGQYDDRINIFEATVGGNVELDENKLGEPGDLNTIVYLERSTVDGRIQVNKNRLSGGSYNEVDVYGNHVENELEVEKNTALTAFGEIALGYNVVGGNATFDENVAETTNAVYGNEITGDLSCKSNKPGPNGLESPNTAKEMLGQCEGL